jgi:DNA polymerase-3 subunit epsilon/ATP-dependent DNA helicase DinG
MEHHADQLFKALYSFLQATGQLGNSDFTVYIRLTQQLREMAEFSAVRETFGIFSEFTEAISAAMARLSGQLASLRERAVVPDLEDLIAGTHAASRYTARLHGQLRSCLITPAENTTCWIEYSRDNMRLSLHTSPIHLAPLLQKHMWDVRRTAILSSSAMRTGGSFHFIRDRLGAARGSVAELAINNPHDYRASTLLLLPGDMPEPVERERYPRTLERILIELATAVDGHMLGLFTSFTQLRQVSQTLAARLALGNIAVFDQSDGSSDESLIEGFRNNPRSVLLGGRGFWDTVDFAPDRLRVLVIPRLPFAVPSDPLVVARSEGLDDAFNDYTLPDAILKVRQGFSRIRRGADTTRTVVVILDKRMVTKDYGRLILESLPPCTVRKLKLDDVVSAARDWLGAQG